MDSLSQVWTQIFSPKDRRPIYEWASDNLSLPPILAMPGHFDVQKSRHFIEIFDALQDDLVRQVTIRKPVRGGGTLIGDIWHTWTRANDAGSAMAILHKEEVAESHAETRLIPTMLSVLKIRALLPSDRNKIRKDEILFADGLPLYVVGPSIANLQTRGIRFMSIDESWLMPSGIIEMAKGRLGDFAKMQTDKLLLISQAGTEIDDFATNYFAGHCATWHVQCQKCEHFMIPHWSAKRADGSRWGMRWDEHKESNGTWAIGKCLESVRFECESCGHPHIDGGKIKNEWNRTGKYIALNPNASRSLRSFTWNGVIDYPWVNLVEKYLSALNAYKMGIIELLIQFFQQYLAEPRSENSIHAVVSEVPISAYEVSSDWAEEIFRFMSVDVQESEFWIIIRAWAKTGFSRRLWFGKKYNWTELEALQQEFKVHNTHVFIDCAYRTREVYRQCCRHGGWQRIPGLKEALWIGWHPVEGDAQKNFLHKLGDRRIARSYDQAVTVDADLGTSHEGPRSCQKIRFSDFTMQERLDGLLRKGMLQSPGGDSELEQTYKRHIASEFKRQKKDKFTGTIEWKYVCPSGQNHARDCEKMGILAATLAQILPDTEFGS